MSSENKDPVRVAAGLKATLHRDNVSDEAKQNAEERLKEMGAISSDQPTSNHAHGTSLCFLCMHNAGVNFFFFSPPQENTRRPPRLVCYSCRFLIMSDKMFLSDEATSEKAQAHAREVLEAAGYTVTDEEVDTDEYTPDVE
ncbi:hypothetical protein FB451DRAFT_1037518 [Mycena latifolia]|nr:hypothetical protein FB451DRAFT_1037518 [Mycena latifolia]